jgi:uncharacterized membrane protein
LTLTVMRRGGKGGGSSGGKLGTLRGRLGASFWFLPALITASAVPLFFLTQYLDQLTYTYLGQLPIVFSGGATAARAVVSSIAGSFITVVTTVFSITIVTLQLASSSYTPRIMRTFTSDLGVQVVLGAYVGTFLYALLVLRIIRTPESEGASFNPVISTTTAVVLALVCVGLLIYFIGHIVNIIQSSTIVGNIHADTLKSIARLDDLDDAPAKDPDTPEDRPELAGLLADDPLVVRAKESGYVQYVAVEDLVEVLTNGTGGVETTILEIPFGPGAFVAAGLPMVRVWPARELSPDDEAEVCDALVFDRERTFQQDFAFGLRQLSDIALKGLSPSLNDPTTAMQAMDRIEAIFICLGEKAMPPRMREEETNGTKVLVKVGYYGFDDVVGLAFDQIRRAAFTAGQVAVLERLLEILERALGANHLPERRRALWARAFDVARLAPQQVSDPEDAANLVLAAVGIGEGSLRSGLNVGPDLERLADLAGDLPGADRVQEAVRGALRDAAAR